MNHPVRFSFLQIEAEPFNLPGVNFIVTRTEKGQPSGGTDRLELGISKSYHVKCNYAREGTRFIQFWGQLSSPAYSRSTYVVKCYQ